AKHDSEWQDFTDATSSDWDHEDVAFESAKQILDGLLNLSAIKPWDFRIPVGYALRTQDDFADVFQLSKYRGKHADWKPYIAHILGFDSKLVKLGFDLVEEIEKLKEKIATLKLELGNTDVNLDQIQGLIEIKKEEATSLEESIEKFDFYLQESSINTNLVEEIDEEISKLNLERYSFSSTRRRIMDSLQAEQIQFKPDVAQKLFEEAGVVFPGEVVKEFSDLIRFNKEISEERIEYLKLELEQVNKDLEEVSDKLEELNYQRQMELNFLGETESFSKYREMNRKLLEIKNTLSGMERQRDALLGIREHGRKLKNLNRKREDQIDELQANIDQCGVSKEGRYTRIRSKLANLCERFLGHKALINTFLNNEGNIEVHAEYLDAENQPTSEDEGKSYRQSLCAAYDLAITQVLLEDNFLRFVYLDGLLEGMDDRIKLNMIEVLREFSDLGIQQILTVIDSDLPYTEQGEKFSFEDEEVVLVLHDEGASGRLFRMETW
ncbi:MAG: DUF2326 domain-containing protein, partial [Gimesia chilikensis]